MKPKFVVLILLISYVLFIEEVFSKDLLYKNKIDFNQDTNNNLKNFFIPLGFDEDKKFSYLYKKTPEEVGCDFWSFKVLELSKDKMLENLETPYYDCFKINKNPELDNFELHIDSLINKHNIVKKNLKLNTFPLHIKDKQIDTCLSSRSNRIIKNSVIKYNRQVIVFEKHSNKAKVIANFEEIEFAGLPQTHSPKIEGYFQNTDTGRLAIVVSYLLKEDNIKNINIYGASLHLKSNSHLASICKKNQFLHLPP